MLKPVEDLESIAAKLRPHFTAEDEAREKALRSCRQVIRYSASAIRAVHRQEHDKARQLLDSAHELVLELNHDLAEHGKLLHAGFIHDAQKEFAEGCIISSLNNSPVKSIASIMLNSFRDTATIAIFFLPFWPAITRS